MAMTLPQVLDEAITVLEHDPKLWTQHGYAHDQLGLAVDPRDPSAVCWCIIGYMSKISEITPLDIERQLPASSSLISANDNAEDLVEAVRKFRQIQSDPKKYAEL